MRFKTSVRNISTFSSAYQARSKRPPLTPHTELTAALYPIGKIAWLRLSEEDVGFVIKQVDGTQVWAYVSYPRSLDCPADPPPATSALYIYSPTPPRSSSIH